MVQAVRRKCEDILEQELIESADAAQTLALGRRLGAAAQAGEIYCLSGALGVGKTVFAKGFAEGLSIQEPVNSPTFTIVQEYEGGRLPFYHFDVYRIGTPDELYEIGLDEYLFGQGVCLIEWAEQITEVLPETCIWIRLEKELQKGTDYRRITVRRGGHA